MKFSIFFPCTERESVDQEEEQEEEEWHERAWGAGSAAAHTNIERK